ncbi:MAG: TPM domain-containing protein [Flavobacteriales bacterium]|jgi:uncharacterized protein|nr:TPM domain-containing protein [Flavobacteriales bacterium]
MPKAIHPVGLLLLLLVLSSGGCTKEHPVGHVLDMEEVLTPGQHRKLDSLFRAHEAITGNEIALVSHATFNGRSAMEYATAFGDSAGVGEKDKDNGVVIAFSKARREVFIATGYGTERVLHDSICQRIVDNEMLPRFKQEDYFGGLYSGGRSIVDFLARPENRIP